MRNQPGVRVKKKRRLKPGVIVVFIAIPALIVLFLGGWLCKQYLIEQVQIAHIPRPQLPISRAAGRSSTASKHSADSAVSAALAPVRTVSDDWNYVDSSLSIHISKSTVIFGIRKSVMFAADVKLSDMGYFQTAFARNEFGRNITESVKQTAKSSGALLAINGDYYGFRDDGIIVRNGTLYRNQPVRDMLAVFRDGSMAIDSEKAVNIPSLIAKGLIDTLSFGPALVVNGKPAPSFPKMTTDLDVHFQNPNPRTGIGFFSPKHFLFLIVDGRSPSYSVGMTLAEFAQEFVKFGCSEAYNLDGGGSSTLYFNGRVVNNPLGRNLKYQRRVSDIVLIAAPAGASGVK